MNVFIRDFLITAIFAVIGFIITTVYPYTYADFWGLMVSFTAFIVGLIISFVQYLDTFKRDINKQFSEFRLEHEKCHTSLVDVHKTFNKSLEAKLNMRDSVKIGKPDAAYWYIIDRFSEITAIRNTHVKKEYVTANQMAASKDALDAYAQGINELVKRHGSVSDIVSKTSLEFFKSQRNDAIESSKKHPGTYDLRCLDTEIPYINYMILDTNDGREVLYGWAFDNEHISTASVFKTKDPAAVEYFYNHFLFLKSVSDKCE